jgi:hypothetical protein
MDWLGDANDGGGALGGLDIGVKLLQEELDKLATMSGNFDCSPGRTDGTMSLGTIVAMSHAAGVLGGSVNSNLGKSVDIINLIKKPLSKIPYAGQVIDIVLSPWIIDSVFNSILAIVGIIPGAGDATQVIKKAVDAFKLVISGAASAIAGAIALARKSFVKPLNGALDDDSTAWWRGSSRRGPEFYDPTIHGLLLGDAALTAKTGLPISTITAMTPTGRTTTTTTTPASTSTRPVIQVGGSGSRPACGNNQYRNAAGVCVPTPPCPANMMWNVAVNACTKFEVRDHTRWPAGRGIVPSEWSKLMQYRGKAAYAELPDSIKNAIRDRATLLAARYAVNTDVGAQLQAYLRRGVVAFFTFRGSDASPMGAFYNRETEELAIVPIPESRMVEAKKKKNRKSLWGRCVDAVEDTIDYASNVIGDVVDATGDFLSDLWDAVAEQAVMVYETVKKYGCALVSSDLVVALAATGAGIVASPAASAAIVSGAAAGRTGCALLEVGELIYAILKLLSMDFPKPPPLALDMTQITAMTVTGRIGAPRVAPSGQVILGSPLPTYPTGSIARFNLDKGMWVIYAPVTSLSGVLLAPDVIPSPPEGFVEVGQSVARPPGTQAAGDERDGHWYDSKLVWAGAGVAFLGGVVAIRRYRHPR